MIFIKLVNYKVAQVLASLSTCVLGGTCWPSDRQQWTNLALERQSGFSRLCIKFDFKQNRFHPSTWGYHHSIHSWGVVICRLDNLTSHYFSIDFVASVAVLWLTIRNPRSLLIFAWLNLWCAQVSTSAHIGLSKVEIHFISRSRFIYSIPQVSILQQ